MANGVAVRMAVLYLLAGSARGESGAAPGGEPDGAQRIDSEGLRAGGPGSAPGRGEPDGSHRIDSEGLRAGGPGSAPGGESEWDRAGE